MCIGESECVDEAPGFGVNSLGITPELQPVGEGIAQVVEGGDPRPGEL